MKNKILSLVILAMASIAGALAQNTWLNQLGVIHQSQPKKKLLEANYSYFEVLQDAVIGAEVVGRVALANNSFENVEYQIVGGTGINTFTISKFVNSKGKNFGVIKVSNLPMVNDTYTLKVKATFDDGTFDEQLYVIKKVSKTIAEEFYQFAFSRLSRNGRLNFSKSDDVVKGYLDKMQANGSFSDLPFGLTTTGWAGLCTAAERLNSVAMAYLNSKSVYYKSEAIKQQIYTALIFHSTEYAKNRTQWQHPHPWPDSDPIAGIGLHFYKLLRDEMNSVDPIVSSRAIAVYDAVLDNCDNMFAERMSQRPVIPNANRNHRMRSLVVRAAISYDYNRALTDWDLWYDTIDPRIPGYYPTGAYRDLMQIMETSFLKATTYINRDGFFPDGTICHHPDKGIQFTATSYSWGWLQEWSVPLINQFKNTIYQAKNATYDVIADALLDSYRPFIYNGSLDVSIGGFYPRASWGSNLLGTINGLISGKNQNTTITQEPELLNLKNALQASGPKDPRSFNKAFWNLESLVQQRPDYAVSAKLISTRSRGLERGLNLKSYHYLGDGALFVRVAPTDYENIINHYDWHAIPGITAEQRGKTVMPIAAESGYMGANGTNIFAGVVSNGSIGMGAFKYERNHTNPSLQYSTVNANKGYFFFDREIVALGNSVKRVRPGDNKVIWTTLNQLEWKDDISYGNVSSDEVQSIGFNLTDEQRAFDNITNTMWFYHDKVGYVVIPQIDKPLNIKLIADTRDFQFPYTANKKKKMFQLVVDHGVTPSDESYQYIILPATTMQNVKEFAQSIGQSAGSVKILSNNASVMAVYHSQLDVIQLAFYQAGNFEYTNKSNEIIRLNVDRPAIVMVKDLGDSLQFSLSDPMHSMTNSTIKLKINVHLENQTFDSIKNESTIDFEHSLEEVLAGKPILKRLKKEGGLVTQKTKLTDNSNVEINIDQFDKTIRLHFKDLNCKKNIQLINSCGQVIWTENVKPLQSIRSLSSLTTGIYFMKVSENDKTTCSKVVIY